MTRRRAMATRLRAVLIAASFAVPALLAPAPGWANTAGAVDGIADPAAQTGSRQHPLAAAVARRGTVLIGSLGLLAGATLGLVGGSLGCWDQGSDCSATGAALLGAAVGTALGAGTGAIIGAAAGHWRRVYPGLGTGEPARAEQAPRRWAGRQLSFGAGRTLSFDDAGGSSWSARIDFGTAGERVAFALEAGWHRRVWLVGPVVRVFSSSSRWQPYALGGLGLGGDHEVSLGGGVRRSESTQLTLEARWHRRGSSISGGRGFATVQAGLGFATR